jgi:hypothetical protein
VHFHKIKNNNIQHSLLTLVVLRNLQLMWCLWTHYTAVSVSANIFMISVSYFFWVRKLLFYCWSWLLRNFYISVTHALRLRIKMNFI